jgi:hypothetical protein
MYVNREHKLLPIRTDDFGQPQTPAHTPVDSDNSDVEDNILSDLDAREFNK